MAEESRSISKISVPIVSDVGQFSKGLDKARKDADKFSRENERKFSVMGNGIKDSISKATDKLRDLSHTNLGVVTSGLVGLAAAAVAATAALTTVGFRNIADIGKQAEELGVSAEALSRLRGVARAAGVDFKDLNAFVAGLTTSITESIGKSTNASEAFKALGTSAEELAKMTPEQQIATLNKGFAGIPKEADRARIASLLLGKDASKMFRLLTLGATDFAKAFDNAPIVTDEEVSEIRRLQIAIDKIGASIQSMADLFTTKVAPAIASVAELIEGLASKFGVFVRASSAGLKIPELPKAAGATVTAQDQARIAAQQKAQADRQADAAKAQAAADKLQSQYDKQAAKIASQRASYVPSTNGQHYKLAPRQQRMLDQHSDTAEKLKAAQDEAREKLNLAKSKAQLLLEGNRTAEVNRQVNDLRQEYRQAIESSGKDEIHRRADTIKGLTADQRKHLISEGYQAREANRTSSLRDELQESTKLPVEKLQEDLARINRLVALGAENGGLTKLQGIRAAAMKTADSGIAGGEPRYAGALQANSIEGRSYLLSQIHRTDDPVNIARQGLALTGQSNNLLGGILNAVSNRREIVASL